MSVEEKKEPGKISRREFLIKAGKFGLAATTVGLTSTGCGPLLKSDQDSLQEGAESFKSVFSKPEKKDLPVKPEISGPLQLASLEELKELFYPQVKDLKRGFFLLWKDEYTPDQVAKEISLMNPFYSSHHLLNAREIEDLYNKRIIVTGKELIFIIPPEFSQPKVSPDPSKEKAEWMTLTYEAPATNLCPLKNLADSLGVDAEELAVRNDLQVDDLIRGGTVVEIPTKNGFYPSEEARKKKIRWFPNRLVQGWDIAHYSPDLGKDLYLLNLDSKFIEKEIVSSTANFWSGDTVKEVKNLLIRFSLEDKEGKETMVFYGFKTKATCLVEVPSGGKVKAGEWEKKLPVYLS